MLRHLNSLVVLLGMIAGIPAGSWQAAQPRGTSGSDSSYAREHIPFTNGDLTNISILLPTLFIAGDSTAARNSTDIQRGWGAVLVDYFDTGKINLVNCAVISTGTNRSEAPRRTVSSSQWLACDGIPSTSL